MTSNQSADPVQLVRDYATEMNAWEQAFAREWGEHGKTYLQCAPAAQMAVYRERELAILDRYREAYRAIFARSCTPRERKYGGPDGPQSAGTPTRFAGITPDAPAALAQPRPGRTEVTFESTHPIGPAAFRFVLLKTRAGWRIDSYKRRRRSENQWVNGIL